MPVQPDSDTSSSVKVNDEFGSNENLESSIVQSSATASLNYKLPFAKGKAVNIGVSYSDQQSNIATNTKDKLTPSVGLVISF